jgi:hypothetical protein
VLLQERRPGGRLPHQLAPAPPQVLKQQRGVVILGSGQQQPGDRGVLGRERRNRGGRPLLAAARGKASWMAADPDTEGPSSRASPAAGGRCRCHPAVVSEIGLGLSAAVISISLHGDGSRY